MNGSEIRISHGKLTFRPVIEIGHLKNSMKKFDEASNGRRPPFTDVGGGWYSAAITRLTSLVKVLSWYGPVSVVRRSTFKKTCHSSCAAAASSTAECVCACGGLYHRRGIDADVVLPQGGLVENVPIKMYWDVDKNGHFDPDTPDRKVVLRKAA